MNKKRSLLHIGLGKMSIFIGKGLESVVFDAI